jgi:cob(I)alamin adenosyltransferase
MAERQGLIIVNTGDGKGKTTAALGLLFRAWGRGWKVVMYQFVKASTGQWGEIRAAKKIGIEIVPMGDGFTWDSKDMEKTTQLARDCWETAKARILSGEYDIVFLDEMTYTFQYGWLDVNEVISVLRDRPDHVHVVITGRNAPPELVEAADLVSEIQKVKHPFDKGIRAQAGIEF